MELDAIQAIIYCLIQKFVERQSLVLEAIRELRPDKVMRAENDDNSEIWEQWSQEDWQALVLDYARRPAIGNWGENQEWSYFLHGAGCRLIHKVTQERIEWDLGSLQTFDKFWFVNHLQSTIDHTSDEPMIILKGWYENENKPQQKIIFRPLHDAIFPILEQLYLLGLLSKNEQYYTLLSTDYPPATELSSLN